MSACQCGEGEAEEGRALTWVKLRAGAGLGKALVGKQYNKTDQGEIVYRQEIDKETQKAGHCMFYGISDYV